jgi:26S proteasome regulatory subunit N12
MTTVQQLVPLFEQFKQAYNANKYAEATSALNQLKKRFVGLKSFLPQHQPKGAVPQDVRQEILLVRETLELAILLSAKTKDLESFERNMSQVKTYYSFTATNIEKSAREQLIQGLNLMRLLAQNKIADFHTELELIPIDLHSNMYIKYPIDLELYLMEGSHNKLRQARAQVPVPEYLIFMDILMETVRFVTDINSS